LISDLSFLLVEEIAEFFQDLSLVLGLGRDQLFKLRIELADRLLLLSKLELERSKLICRV
jgi:hypothetical protein